MSDHISNGDRLSPYMTPLDLTLRGVLLVNFALFILSFIPAFSGFGHELGLADRLWGVYRVDGWRADVAWMCTSTPFIALASIPFIVVGGVTQIKQRRYHRTAIFCLVWLACFLVYLVWILVNMF